MATLLKNHKVLILHLILIFLLTVLVFIYVEEIQSVKSVIYNILFTDRKSVTKDDLVPVEISGDEWFVNAPMIYHAGGAIQDNTYTNSREAVEKTLSEGNFFIEIDFSYTSDGHLVCAHEWADIYPSEIQPTLEEFLANKVQGRFTPMTAKDIIQLMRDNPQMYLVTDIKETDIRLPIAELALLADNDPDVLDRFIIQLYTGREKSSILEIYPFADSQFLFTLYKWGGWNLEAIKICNEEDISVITVGQGLIPDEDVALLRELGFTIYEHTVNRLDIANVSLQRGISSFYTDFLSPSDLTA